MGGANLALVRFMLVASALALVLGCGGVVPYDVVPVTAKVTYEDGSLIPGEYISVAFHAQVEAVDSATSPRVGGGTINAADGTVEGITTYEYGDGLIQGKHKVTLTVGGAEAESSTAIPGAYTDPASTPLEIEVTESDQHFDVKVAKPN